MYLNYISDDKMTYSYKAIFECRDMVKEFQWAAPKRKSDFWNVLVGLEQLYQCLYDTTGCILFAPDDYNFYLIRFSRLVNVYRDATKKELVTALKENEMLIKSQLQDIYHMMENGEVNTII